MIPNCLNFFDDLFICLLHPFLFFSDHNVDVIVPKIKAIGDLWLFKLPINIPFYQKDICSYLIRGRCPLKVGDYVSYYFTYAVNPTEFRVNADIEISLERVNGETLGCLRLPISVV